MPALANPFFNLDETPPGRNPVAMFTRPTVARYYRYLPHTGRQRKRQRD